MKKMNKLFLRTYDVIMCMRRNQNECKQILPYFKIINLMNLDVKFFAFLLIPRCYTYTLSFLRTYTIFQRINYSGMKKLTTIFDKFLNNNWWFLWTWNNKIRQVSKRIQIIVKKLFYWTPHLLRNLYNILYMVKNFTYNVALIWLNLKNLLFKVLVKRMIYRISIYTFIYQNSDT